MEVIAATRKVLALAESFTKGDGISSCLAYSSTRHGYWQLMVVTSMEEMIEGSLAYEGER